MKKELACILAVLACLGALHAYSEYKELPLEQKADIWATAVQQKADIWATVKQLIITDKKTDNINNTLTTNNNTFTINNNNTSTTNNDNETVMENSSHLLPALPALKPPETGAKKKKRRKKKRKKAQDKNPPDIVKGEGLPAEVEDLPADFRICRIVNPSPIYGQPVLQMENSTLLQSVATSFRYQCAGPPYNKFMQQHQFPLVLRRHQQDPTLHWGKRPNILPPPKNKNQKLSQTRHVLIIGNSHTRQVAESLLCQYSDQILSHQIFKEPDEKQAVQYILTGNLILSVITNHPAVYSRRWKTNLEGIVQKPLSELDAIVLGKFNPFNSKYTHSNLWMDVANYGLQFPEQETNAAKYNPPGFLDLAKEYPPNKPIIWLSEFKKSAHKLYLSTTEQIQSLAKKENRTNLRSIDAAQYRPQMNGAYCTTHPVSAFVETCAHGVADMHRCMGDKGGEPDLAAWDVIEALWDVLS